MARTSFRVRRSKHQIDSLESNLVETPLDSTASAWMSETSITNRYERKILNERRHISFALLVQKDISMKSTQEMQSLQKKVHSLEKQTRRMEAEGSRYNKKLAKLYEAQGLTSFLYQQREQAREQQAREQQKRRQVCSSLRTSDKRNMELSRIVYQQQLKKRIKGLKDNSERNSLEKAKFDMSILETNREKYLRVRNEEDELRHRLRRIQEFKQKRARKNYLDKVESELQRNLQRQQQLNELAELEKGQVEALQQTRKLEKESKQIEKLFENFFSTEC